MDPKKDDGVIKVTGGLLARNAVLNFFGQLLPLLVGIITIPLVVNGLGTEQFGLLSLVLIILGYFAIFDLGLGRATTKYVAEALGKNEIHQIPSILWTSVSIQAVLGFFCGVVLSIIAPFLVEEILNIPPYLICEAKFTLYLIALSIPLVMISSSFTGFIQANQRFDLQNSISIPFSILSFILPLIGIYLGFQLSGIVILLLVARCGSLITYLMACFHIFPQLKRYSYSSGLLSRLFIFGGWATISNIVSPLMVYMDRFLIGAILTISAVTYYTVPYDIVTRLWIISSSLILAVFPAFSTLEGLKERIKLEMVFARSLKYLFITIGPLAILGILFSWDILQIWLGNDFARESTLTMQILTIGVLINSLANIPFALLQGSGRPEIPAKFHLIELSFYIVILWIFVSNFGISGAACAWTIRVIVDAFLLFWAISKIFYFNLNFYFKNKIFFTGTSLIVFAVIEYIIKVLTMDLPLFIPIILISGFFILFIYFTWSQILDASDRALFNSALNKKS